MDDNLEKALWTIGGAALGFLVAEFRNYLAKRRSQFESVVDRYVAEVQKVQDPDIRLLAMQRAGVASLNRENFGRFIAETMKRGCLHPCKGTMVDGIIPEESIPIFIDEATQDQVPLSDQFAVHKYIRAAFSSSLNPPKEIAKAAENNHEK